ncbi:MAG: putative protein disulfide isomerase [Streblomastix strix]|uniref:Thioredoxin domain-containing protein n=1 Tax=Streblomastix strix TaxID=222440 RepID=A0A5J4WU07_9EUKA|nr:MAG: putative protein disulfide isomerase [Streblomastix strix]
MATAKRKRLSLLLGSLICSSIAFLLVGDSGTITKTTVITQTVKVVEPTRQDDKKPDQVPEVTPPTPPPVKQEEQPKIEPREPVVSLNTETFEQAKSSGELWIVKFFNPGCGHCRAFAPTYLEFGQQMVNHQYLHVGEVSCSEYTGVCSSQGVNGVPTVNLYYKGKKTQFSGSRTVDTLKQFVEENIVNLKVGK